MVLHQTKQAKLLIIDPPIFSPKQTLSPAPHKPQPDDKQKSVDNSSSGSVKMHAQLTHLVQTALKENSHHLKAFKPAKSTCATMLLTIIQNETKQEMRGKTETSSTEYTMRRGRSEDLSGFGVPYSGHDI